MRYVRAEAIPLVVAGIAVLVGGCAIIPDVPSDTELPVREILITATCELRRAFIELDQKQYASFGAKNWLIAVAVTPKTDREVLASAGLTGKSTTDPKIPRFFTWSAIPGAQVDAKGTRNASVTYNFHSKDLIDVKKFPLDCHPASPNYSVLTEHLSIRDWLIRTVTANQQSVGALAKLDKPTFSSEIFVKFSGNGGVTYNFPFGTNVASLTGNYDMDETLSIALSPDSSKEVIVVQTLPTGGNFGDRPPDHVPTLTTIDSQARLDAIQHQQAIVDSLKNLRQ
jgi:hypothetical protein